ncbi:MAG: hypothetical protein AAF483_01340 [Planctomycetota bacterium]
MKDIKTTKRFKEKYGSYPVLRIHSPEGRDIAGRIDGNLVAGRIPVVQVLQQMQYARNVFAKAQMQKQRQQQFQDQFKRNSKQRSNTNKLGSGK